MALDSNYVAAFTIETVILDKDTGAPLSGGLVYFEQDNQRGVLKAVYQITGTSPNYSYTELPNPMVLSSIGTFEDAMGNPVIPYFFPYDSNFEPEYYYVRVTSSEDVPQFVREAVPDVSMGGGSSITSTFVNELSNPQFINAFFKSPTVYSFSAASNESVAIAPGWEIVVSSAAAATVTLSIITPTGALNRVTNPGTILNINSTGVSSLRLRQRLYGSPNLWGSDYVAGTFVAKTYAGTSSTVSLLYSQSNGSVVDQVISTGVLTADGLYSAFPGSVFIPASSSTEFYPDAYVDIEVDIPAGTEVDITSVMVAATGVVSVDSIVYDQTSYARQVDELFNYYKPQLDFKPISSYLVGWDFPLNPALANGDTIAVTANTNAYTYDQTILFQSNPSIIETRRTNNKAMALEAVAGDSQLAVIQYLPENVVRNMLENRLSSNIEGDTSQAGGLTGTVSLWYTTNAGVPALPNSLVTSLDANGYPSAVASGWTEIPRDTGLGTAQFTLISTLENYGFNGWDLTQTNIPNTATFFAIVVGFANLTSGSGVSLNSVSVVPGDIPTKPAPQTLDQVLQECQYYYEKSYPVTVVPGSASADGSLSAYMLPSRNAGNTDNTLVARQFDIRYNTQKRSSSAVCTLYALSGAINEVTGFLFSSGVEVLTADVVVTGNWQGNTGRTGIVFRAANVTELLAVTIAATTSAEAFIEFQYTADARLGIV